METLGKISEWRDDRGFGFITPLQDVTQRVFFHIRDYKQSGRRPENGELVKYVAERHQGRLRATSVRRAVGSSRKEKAIPAPLPRSRSRRAPAWLHYALLVAYFAGLAWAIAVKRLPFEFALAVLAMSAIAYMAYALDKHAAQTGRWRIPESNLHLIELLGGWPGALLAQRVLRHKTSKPSYRDGFWLVTFGHLLAIALWITRQGIPR